MFLKEKSDIIEQAMPCKKEYIHLLQDSYLLLYLTKPRFYSHIKEMHLLAIATHFTL